jgi:roadblock/LC7 domain-containing protein
MEKTIVSAVTLITSLGAYFYAKHTGKDAVPYVMIAGVAGAWIGEVVAAQFCKKDKDDNNSGKA